jgi:predicted transposase YbfD/YdcC
MSSTLEYLPQEVSSFLEALGYLIDPRDPRGRRHGLVFIVAAVVLAILSGRSSVSSIYRFIGNRLEWLREVTGQAQAQAISRAHLPRLLARLDWAELNALIEAHFGVRMERNDNQEWVAIDGKVLRGAVGSGEKQAVVLAVSHQSRTVLAQAPMKGHKASEIPVVRELLKSAKLEAQKVSLDAHHCNPKTTAQIHQAGGEYVIQVKQNQPKLLEHCQHLAATVPPRASYDERTKGHGRSTTRKARAFAINSCALAPRWAHSRVQTLVVVERQTHTPATGKTSLETAYYICNRALGQTPKAHLEELSGAIRQHWHVESDNWIRDVTFKEDHIKTCSANQAQIMGGLRGLAMRLLRKLNVGNFQAALEEFVDCPNTFISFLKRVKFL